ncbi:volume-regulated anion channel subunit LRRC8A [Hyphodiscus hymeniophilus]|uniref:Volume-regulated anion channel subunit LRRC8A n=1 Tax=Hyphodiscus hymeniophilus TaxID=353542 RepID=A0A9P6VQJ3_9HELO|nr:volume-regulated anion channel subunit LRRC8A [Hyphodiscus hymeniophilus]
MSNPQTLEDLRSGSYKGVKRLKLSANLSSFPTEIFSLFDTLEILDLSGNPLSVLPNDFSRLHKLKTLFLSDCKFATFPAQLVKCRSLEMIAFKNNHMITIPEGSFPRKLRWLILTNNEIESLPASIGHCHRLQKCMMAGNRLTRLPDEMAHCRKLGLLRLSSNNLATLPDWLFQLPELSFLSFAGNPCAPAFSDNPILSEIIWSELSTQHLLGEGASGIISKGTWKASDGDREVAIKVFKGEVTSDGSPMDEMNACIAAGQHPNLIDPIGKIHGHPEKKGLVLQLIPPHYTNLGLPPDFSTCTRDRFARDLAFSAEKCRSVLYGVADASKHIHERGIAHGDLYAHNTLIDNSGHALLGDFGAATIYGDHEKREAIERMEILAFGHLIEDLVNLVEHRLDGDEVLGEKDGYVIEGLNALHYKCTNPIVMERPNFEEAVEVLGGL